MNLENVTHIPIVFLHGFMGTTLAHFGKAIKSLYGKYPLIGIDLPGHGYCSYDKKIDHYYQNSVEYVIDQIKTYKQVNLIGASYLGGTIALNIALQKPELINKLILTGFTYDVPQKAFCAWANNFKSLARMNIALTNEYKRLHGSHWESTMDTIIANINLEYDRSIKVTSNRLRDLKKPVLLLNGDYKDSEVRAAETFNTLSSYFKSKVIKGAGHIVAYDKPSEFCNAIEDFFNSN